MTAICYIELQCLLSSIKFVTFSPGHMINLVIAPTIQRIWPYEARFLRGSPQGHSTHAVILHCLPLLLLDQVIVDAQRPTRVTAFGAGRGCSATWSAQGHQPSLPENPEPLPLPPPPPRPATSENLPGQASLACQIWRCAWAAVWPLASRPVACQLGCSPLHKQS